MTMKKGLNKLKDFLKWLFKWLKYIIIIIIDFLSSLFKKEERVKIEKEKQKLNEKKKESIQNISKIIPENPKPLIKNSSFYRTKEELKEEILKFYCEEKNRKIYELEKQEEILLEYLEEKLIPILEEEIIKKHIKTEEMLKKQIKKLATDELLNSEEEKKKKMTISKQILNDKKEKRANLNLNIPLTPTKKETAKTNEMIIQITEPIQKRSFPTEIQIKMPKEKEEKNNILSSIANNVEKEETITFSNKENLIKIVPPIITPTIPKEETIELQIEEPFKELLKEEIVEITKPIYEEAKEKQKDAKKQMKMEENAKNKEEKQEEFIAIDLFPIEKECKNLELEQEKIEKQIDFEDKNYDELLLKIENLLKELEKMKTLNLKPEDKKQVLVSVSKLKNLQNNIENKKIVDLEREKTLLEENITEEEITGLLENLKKLHLEHQIDLNEYLINKAEDLENLSKEKLKRIEKELIKIKIKKASRSLELPTLILLPFIRNRYFFMFTAGIFVNNHLNILDNLLKHKETLYTPPPLEHIKKGSDSLEEALNLTATNLIFLNYLEQNILAKYPELSLDEEYLLYINKLRYSLLKNEEKLLKKKQTIEKYNLKYQIKIRKLKKKKKVA